MTVMSKIRRQGGAAVMTIPPALLKLMHADFGSRVELNIDDGKLVVRLVTSSTRRRYSLQELLTGSAHVGALNAAVAGGDVKESDANVLYEVARRGKCKPGDLRDVLPGSPSSRSHKLKKLLDANLLLKVRNPAGYGIGLWQNQLTIHVVRRLDELGMLPSVLKD